MRRRLFYSNHLNNKPYPSIPAFTAPLCRALVSWSHLTIHANSLGAAPSDKLARKNYLVWHAQILTAPIRGARHVDLLDGTNATRPQTVEHVGHHKDYMYNVCY
jgi:hypothetical protein